MQDLKTGALLKASPRSQFYGQMIGSLASVFVSVGAYKLYTRIYEVGRDPLFPTSEAYNLGRFRDQSSAYQPPRFGRSWYSREETNPDPVTG
jgi:hypothetical protein